MKNLLVTGADGQLGRFVGPVVQDIPDFRVRLVTRDELDLSSEDSIERFFKVNGRFDVILNLAAYTQVDLAESEIEMSEQINAVAPALLSMHCKQMIHMSTDYVFDGEKGVPYNEEDVPRPMGQYGASKLRGEKRLLIQNPNSIIIRTSWLYSELPGNFLTKILKLTKERPELKIVNDQIGTPTYAGDLAKVIGKILIVGAQPGVYHFSGEGQATWYEFARTFLSAVGSSTPVVPVHTSEFKTAARRPPYSVLDKTKIKTQLGITIQPWQESLKICLQTKKIY